MSLEEEPNRHGFDHFAGHRHGALDYVSHVTRYGNIDWSHNETAHNEEGYCTDLITDHAVQCIQDQQANPFFLFVSHSKIYFPWMAPDDPANGKPGVRYEDLSKLGPHPPEKVGAIVRQMVESLDDSVGRIVDILHDLDLERDTLVLFTSDNGGIRKYAGVLNEISDNGPFRDGKGSVYEGGHRVPAIAYWPGTIAPGQVSEETATTMDLSTTFLALAETTPPAAPSLDGIDPSPTLLKNAPLPNRETLLATPQAEGRKDGPQEAVRRRFWSVSLQLG
ncbi:MAG: hypothetical protein CME19_22140 [Gemmatimonadetes bacterium]|nr:hypothetical protein [Gemmatimonadota bacterium]